MIRLHVVVEGQTEESLVRHTLAPHLAGLEIFATPIVVTTRRDRTTGKKIGQGGGRWVLHHIPSYQKTVHGPLVLGAVGLAGLRAACPRFGAWVSRLESL